MPSRFLSVEDLANLPEPQWLIQGLFEVGSLVMLVGPAASYKSFLALDWALTSATNRTWCGRSTTPSKILYVLGEGKSSLLKRVEAWSFYHRLSREERQQLRENFRVCFEVPQLANKADVDKLLKDLKHEGFTPDVIIIDTFARSFVGKDENSQMDTGVWIESADRLRQLGMTVIVLHHTAKNTEFGLKYRGSTAIMGAMDSAFTLERDAEIKNIVKLTCTKQKDHDEGDPLYFLRNIVLVPGTSEGSVVLTLTDKPDSQQRAAVREEEERIDQLIAELVENAEFGSERARARELAKQMGWGENEQVEGRALQRIRRYKDRAAKR